MLKYIVLGFILLVSIIIFQYIGLRSLRLKFEILKKGEKAIKEEKLHFLFFLLIIVAVLWLLSWFLITTFVDTLSNRGLFGDQFGSINALFSGFALAGIIYTINLQKKELALQREELEETRDEFKIQNVTLKKQRFENTFFQLLSLHNDIVENLKIDIFDGSYEKRNFFEGALKQLKYKSSFSYYKYTFLLKLSESEVIQYLKDKEGDSSFLNKLDEDERRELVKFTIDEYEEFCKLSIEQKEGFIQNDYLKFFSNYQHSLGHYFRNLYHIYKYVFLTDLIPEDEKKMYSNIVRAQLSSDELVLLLYNSFTPIKFSSPQPSLGYPKFKYLIDYFDVLQNMSKNLLLDKDHYKIFENNKVIENPFVK